MTPILASIPSEHPLTQKGRYRSAMDPIRTSETSVDPRVAVGHVHLKVADLDRAISFYSDVLGFEVM